MTRQVFKWGIIGPGRIARKISAAIKRTRGACVWAVASQSAADPKKLLRDFSAERFYSSYEELAADPDVDAIYIATPHRFHFENARLCLQAGKPVLCEKPTTVNAVQAEQLFTISREEGIFCMEALWSRFLPAFSKAKEWIDAGKIGKILHIWSAFGFRVDRPPEDRLLNMDLAGGALLDIGVYNLALTQFFMPEPPRKIFAQGLIGETGVDETVSALMKYAGGATAQFTCTFQAQTENEMVISGSDGRIIIPHPFYKSEIAHLISGSGNQTFRSKHKVNGYEFQIYAAMDAIRGGQIDCPQMRQADSLTTMRLMDMIRRQIGLHYPFE